jgi:signal transduction histidine kinase
MQTLVDGVADTTGERIVVAYSNGRIIADSGHSMVGQVLPMTVPYGGRGVAGEAAPPGPFGGEGVVGVSTGMTMPFNIAVTPVITQAILPGEPAGTAVTDTVSVSWAPVFIPLAMVPLTGTHGVVWTDKVGPGGDVIFTAGVDPGGTQPADLLIARVPNPGGTPTQAGFLNSINQQLMLAMIGAGAVTLLLTWLLSRRIVGPIEALTTAAGRMERGDLSVRVPVTSQDEVGKLAHAFNAMSDSLAQQEQLRRNIVADVAHELRTPISNIRGYLEAARDGVVEPDPALLHSLHEESLILCRLVEDLQELQLAEAGQLKIEMQAVSVAEVVEVAAVALRPTAMAKNVRLETDASPDLPEVQADSARVGQVLRNLIDNAVTHTPAGGRVDVQARRLDDEVEITVQDTGPGIAPEHLPHIFDRFYRADESRARTTGGAGLGLAIVKQLVELHGGHVWVESVPGEGAAFHFTLPIQVTRLEGYKVKIPATL